MLGMSAPFVVSTCCAQQRAWAPFDSQWFLAIILRRLQIVYGQVQQSNSINIMHCVAAWLLQGTN